MKGYLRIDIVRSGIVGRIATKIHVVFVLVYSNPVNLHVGGECQLVKVDVS